MVIWSHSDGVTIVASNDFELFYNMSMQSDNFDRNIMFMGVVVVMIMVILHTDHDMEVIISWLSSSLSYHDQYGQNYH